MTVTREFSLFIADLDPENTQESILEFFRQQLKDATLLDVKVCYDHNPPNKSLRYGYLNFNSNEAADRAYETLNFKQVPPATKPYRLARILKPDHPLRKGNIGNVIVKNLPVTYSTQDLWNNFSSAGNILSVKMNEYPSKASTHGFVQFDNAESAEKAIKEHNGQKIEDKEIIVEVAKAPSDTKHDEVFVTPFANDVTKEVLETFFSPCGKVTKVDIRERNERYSRYAYVWFEDEAGANKAVEDWNAKPVPDALKQKTEATEEKKEDENGETTKQEQQEQLFSVSIYHNKRERMLYKRHLKEVTRFRNLYIRGFPQWYDTPDLQSLFSRFGEITSAKVMKDASGVSRGFGFCCFAKEIDARAAYIEMSGNKIPSVKPESGEEVPADSPTTELYVNYAQLKEEREQSNAQSRSRNQGARSDGYGQYPSRRNRQGARAGPNQRMVPGPFPGMGMYPMPMMPNSPGSQVAPGAVSPASYPLYPRAPFPGMQSPPQNAMQRHNQAYIQQRGRGQVPIQQQQYMNMLMQQRMLPYMNSPMLAMMMGRGMPYPMAGSPAGANPTTGSPLPAVVAGGSPSSTAQSTGSPASTGPVAGQYSPVQVAQTYSPKSSGQPGTPTSSSIPTSPDSSATGSMGGSPSTQPLGPAYINPQQFDNLPMEEQKSILGEALFPRIKQLDNLQAGKITGMLLDLDVTELRYLLENPSALRAKVEEAKQVLIEANVTSGNGQ